jgi:hypothetical protein
MVGISAISGRVPVTRVTSPVGTVPPRVARKRRISSTLWKRSAGFLARARSTARSSQPGIPGTTVLGGGGMSSIWALMIA